MLAKSSASISCAGHRRRVVAGGPYLKSAPEPFDTAIAILSLVQQSKRPDVKQQIEAGRAYLTSCQLTDGSWPETTRPSGAESYAQRISTTAWATLAMLAARGKVANMLPGEAHP